MEDIQQIIIQSVDTETLKATGVNRFGNTIYVDLRIMVAGILCVPKIGENWIVQKVLGQNALFAKLPFQDQRLLLELNWQGRKPHGNQILMVLIYEKRS